MMTNEAEADDLIDRLLSYSDRLLSPITTWETVTAVARKYSITLDAAETALESFIAHFELRRIAIGGVEGAGAIAAHGRYGKGADHPAKLNMGDCFAYACARLNGAEFLYKGDDFRHTDLA